MDTGPIVAAAGRGTAPPRQDGPTSVPDGPAVTIQTGSARPATGSPPATGGGQATAAVQAAPARPAADRRRRLIIVAVIAVLVIAVVAVLVFGHVFTVYGSGNS